MHARDFAAPCASQLSAGAGQVNLGESRGFCGIIRKGHPQARLAQGPQLMHSPVQWTVTCEGFTRAEEVSY